LIGLFGGHCVEEELIEEELNDDHEKDDVIVDDDDDKDLQHHHHLHRQQQQQQLDSAQKTFGSSTLSITRSASITSLTDAHLAPSVAGITTSLSV